MVCVLLARREGQQRQVTSPLDGGGHAALVLRAQTAPSTRQDLPAVADEALEGLHIFVVDAEGRVIDSSTSTISKAHLLNPPRWT